MTDIPDEGKDEGEKDEPVRSNKLSLAASGHSCAVVTAQIVLVIIMIPFAVLGLVQHCLTCRCVCPRHRPDNGLHNRVW